MSRRRLDNNKRNRPAGATRHEARTRTTDPRFHVPARRQGDGRPDRDSETSPTDVGTDPGRQAEELSQGGRQNGLTPASPYTDPDADMHERQRLIERYEEITGATLIVFIDQIFQSSMTYLEDLVADVDRPQTLHMMLASPGGDGETAIRILRAIEWRFSSLTVIVPDMAKSAATLICLGANEILLGPNSDLGPVDPQFEVGNGLVSAKEIVAAINEAEQHVVKNPDTAPLIISLLDVNMLMLQQARNALKRSGLLVREALACVRGRSPEELDTLATHIRKPLVDEPASHSSAIYAQRAIDLGLPVTKADLDSEQWQIIKTLWRHYFALGCFPNNRQYAVYESRTVSMVNPHEP
jgi:Serine dehydrogenase proteinase